MLDHSFSLHTSPFKLLTAVLLLLLAFFFFILPRPHPAVFAMSPNTLWRLREGKETETDRNKLAKDTVIACGYALPDGMGLDPLLVWGDFLPANGQELAVALKLSQIGGLLAVLAVNGDGWNVTRHLGPDLLGVPTSLATLTVPGLRHTALVLTDLADQMAGAYCKRETATVYAADEGWKKLWQSVIESEAYWNRAWDRPQSMGWLRLAGTAQYRAVVKDGLRLVYNYRNSLAQAEEAQDRLLPEAEEFHLVRQTEGRAEFLWDARLGLFTLGKGRLLAETPLTVYEEMRYVPKDKPIPAGRTVHILADDALQPGALLGGERRLRVYYEGRVGFLPDEIVQRTDGDTKAGPG